MRQHPLVAERLLMLCRDTANLAGDRWQRPSRSSRLRGNDLDRRIVNIDPERILREQRAQRRLQNQSQVLTSFVHFLARYFRSSHKKRATRHPKCCRVLPVLMQCICALVDCGLMQAEDE